MALPAALPARKYPPGYRFNPTDLELICEYLKKKINNEPVPLSEIYDVNLYQYNPETLAANYPKLGENEWYFFTPREKKYKNGSRPNRAAGTGFWKASGINKPILLENEGTVVGHKIVLVFYEGRPSNGDNHKTNWIMHEFKVDRPQPSRNKRNADGMKLDDWVLCRIYNKDTKVGENNKIKQAKASTLVDKSNPSKLIKVDVAQVANNESPAQTLDFLKVGSNSNNNNCDSGPIVIYDNNAIPVATDNNVNLRVVPDETTSVINDVDMLFEYLTNDIHNERTPQDALHNQNVPEISLSHTDPSFDWMENSFPQPLNVLDPSFFDIEEIWGIQPGDFQVPDGSWGTQNFDNPPQTGPSNIVGFLETQTSSDPLQTGPSNVGFWETQNSSNPPQTGPSNIGKEDSR